MTVRVLCLACLTLMPRAAAEAQSFDHSTYDTLLALYVQDSRVDYAALRAGREILDRYLSQVAAVTADEFEGWPEGEQIAYLINAYNAYTIETVVDHYPIKGGNLIKRYLRGFPESSIRHIGGVFDGIEHRVAGEALTLDDIEHGRLRVNYNEPRIHFALVCAAVSCPPLRQEAYTGERLDEQLADQGRRFLNDPRANRFDLEGRVIHLSKIFDWYGEDFRQYAAETGYRHDEKVNGVLNFVKRYLLDRTVRFVETGEYDVKFQKYDWTLNDQAIAAAR